MGEIGATMGFKINQLVKLKSAVDVIQATRENRTEFYKAGREVTLHQVANAIFRVVIFNGESSYKLMSTDNTIRSNWVREKHLQPYSSLLSKLKD